MNRHILTLIIAAVLVMLSLPTEAQPKAQRATAATSKPQQAISRRAQLMYPSSPEMPNEVAWRRDLYREINLSDNANAGLYEPVEPIDRRLNLFTYLFKLALNGYIPIYEYNLNGRESFADSARIDIKTVLDDQHIYYERKNNRLHVDNSDIPSADVRLFYLKETAYLDPTNSQFRRKVVALCPVMMTDDEFGGAPTKRPLFWVRYADVEPYLNRQSVTASPLNDAATMTLDDYFTLHCYQGRIYQTGLRQGQRTPQFGYDANSQSAQAEALRQAQQVENELQAFERSVFGHTPQRDSLEAARKASLTTETVGKDKSVKSGRQRRTRAPKASTAKAPKEKSGGARQPRISVRRLRH